MVKKGVKDNSKWFWLVVGIIIGLILGLLLANLFDARQVGSAPATKECTLSCLNNNIIKTCIHTIWDPNDKTGTETTTITTVTKEEECVICIHVIDPDSEPHCVDFQ